MTNGRPVCQRLTLEPGPAGGEISARSLRRVRVGDYLRRSLDAAALWVIPWPNPDQPVIFTLADGEQHELPSEPFGDAHVAVDVAAATGTAEVKALISRRRAAIPVTDDTLAAVADVYRTALRARKPPTVAVMQEWHVSRSTASRWIKRARAAGHLGAAIHRVAGEAERFDAQQFQLFTQAGEDLELIADLDDDTPWPTARAILAEHKQQN